MISSVSLFRTEFNQFNNTEARMPYSTKILLKSCIGVKTSCFCCIFAALQWTSFQTFTKYLIHSYITCNKCNTCRYNILKFDVICIYRGSNIGIHVLLNLRKELRKSDKMRGLLSILYFFRNEFYRFNNTAA